MTPNAPTTQQLIEQFAELLYAHTQFKDFPVVLAEFADALMRSAPSQTASDKAGAGRNRNELRHFRT